MCSSPPTVRGPCANVTPPEVKCDVARSLLAAGSPTSPEVPMEGVWIALGGNAAFLLLVAYLGRKLVAQWFDKDLEAFKQAIADASALELEKARGALEIATNEHSILLSKLQDRRANVVGDIYEHIAAGIEALESYLR